MMLAKRFAALIATLIGRRHRLWPALLVVGLAIVPLATRPLSVDAAVLQVCPSGCLFTTIQGALAAASNGDEIDIAAGTYSGGFTITQNVNLVGAGAAATIINGGAPVVTIAQGVLASIADLTVTGGNYSFSGGGIANLGGSLTVLRSIIRNNHADQEGGGIQSVPGGHLYLESSAIVDNTAGGGGGGIASFGALLSIDASLITGNTAVTDGGGVVAEVATSNGAVTGAAIFSNTTVSGNQAVRDGGGVITNGPLSLIASTITGNTANASGGGLYNALTTGVVSIEDSIFTANHADQLGGGILNGGQIAMRNSAMRDNTASGPGGGMYNLGSVAVLDSNIVGNQAGTNGGGIASPGTLDLEGSVVTGNKAGRNGGGLTTSGAVTQMTISDSRITSNTAQGAGGAVFNFAGTVAVRNTLIVGNGSPIGGAIANAGTLTLTDVTVRGNSGVDGAGLFMFGGQATATNGQVTENNASDSGGGIYLLRGTVQLTNAGVRRNTPNNCFPLNSVPGCAG